MNLNVLGLNFQTAPLHIREKAAIHNRKLGAALYTLRGYSPNGIILSTCNRTEVYTFENAQPDLTNPGEQFIKTLFNISSLKNNSYIYHYKDLEAAKHLFRVAGSLESMIIGEHEVLGQVKNSLDKAQKEGMVNFYLRYLFQKAIETSRRIHKETQISRNALSISSIAVDLAQSSFPDLGNVSMLIIGTGEAGVLVTKIAKSRGVGTLKIMSRTFTHAKEVSDKVGGIPIKTEELTSALTQTDIIVTCSAAPHIILNLHHMKNIVNQRKGSLLVIIDIAVPRNVESAIGSLPGVTLYNIDDLLEVSNKNKRRRQMEIYTAENIIESALDEFTNWWRLMQVKSVLNDLQKKYDNIRVRQLSKVVKRLPALTSSDLKELDEMSKSMVSKILNDPITYLKKNGNRINEGVFKEIFNL